MYYYIRDGQAYYGENDQAPYIPNAQSSEVAQHSGDTATPQHSEDTATPQMSGIPQMFSSRNHLPPRTRFDYINFHEVYKETAIVSQALRHQGSEYQDLELRHEALIALNVTNQLEQLMKDEQSTSSPFRIKTAVINGQSAIALLPQGYVGTVIDKRALMEGDPFTKEDVKAFMLDTKLNDHITQIIKKRTLERFYHPFSQKVHVNVNKATNCTINPGMYTSLLYYMLTSPIRDIRPLDIRFHMAAHAYHSKFSSLVRKMRRPFPNLPESPYTDILPGLFILDGVHTRDEVNSMIEQLTSLLFSTDADALYPITKECIVGSPRVKDIEYERLPNTKNEYDILFNETIGRLNIRPCVYRVAKRDFTKRFKTPLVGRHGETLTFVNVPIFINLKNEDRALLYMKGRLKHLSLQMEECMADTTTVKALCPIHISLIQEYSFIEETFEKLYDDSPLFNGPRTYCHHSYMYIQPRPKLLFRFSHQKTPRITMDDHEDNNTIDGWSTTHQSNQYIQIIESHKFQPRYNMPLLTMPSLAE